VAIDMCTIFKAAIRDALPQARLVVDHFHLVQLANQALTEVRRRVTMRVGGRQGRKGNREWELRNRLTRATARMHAKHMDPMVDDLQPLPAGIGTPILVAWNAKEDLLDLLALARTHPDRAAIWTRLSRFTSDAAPPACRNWNGWPVRYRPGGQKSSPSSIPASPTRDPRAPTGSSRPSPVTPTASEIQ
jgi:transposase